MTLRQIMQRVGLSVLLLGIAFLLSCTSPAVEAHQTTNLFERSPKNSVTTVSKQLQKRMVSSAHTPLFEKSSCSTCIPPYTNPTLTLTLLAVLANFVVMALLIYGFGYVAAWTTS